MEIKLSSKKEVSPKGRGEKDKTVSISSIKVNRLIDNFEQKFVRAILVGEDKDSKYFLGVFVLAKGKDFPEKGNREWSEKQLNDKIKKAVGV